MDEVLIFLLNGLSTSSHTKLKMLWALPIFYTFNCRTLVDADPTQSEQITDAGQVIGVKRLGFDSKDVGDKVIFKTSFNNCTDLYCSNAFKESVEAYGLTGVEFLKTYCLR